MRTLYLDLETTGLDPAQDEILELAIINDTGTVTLDTLVRPVQRNAWPQAQAIHGITPADVRAAPTLDALRPAIATAVRDARIVIYNAPFDAGFLPDELARAADIRCAMRAFAEIHGDWHPAHDAWRWSKLTVAAATLGFAWHGPAHRALTDCQTTRAVWRYTQDPAQNARRAARRREAAAWRGEPTDDSAARRTLALTRLRALVGLDAAPANRPDLNQLFRGAAVRRRSGRLDHLREN